MTPPAIELEGVGKRLGGRDILQEVALTVAPGERIALAGENGAGKTTLIKCLLDLSPPDRGRVRLFGADPAAPGGRRGVAYLPERFSPAAALVGEAQLAYVLGLRGEAYVPDAARALCRELGLGGALESVPLGRYSQGMRQLIGLAGALLGEARLLILDEPMNGLDPGARLRVKRILTRLSGEGRTLFFSTHLLADVDELADRMVILHGGRVRYCGSPEACRARFPAPTLEGSFLRAIDGGADSFGNSPAGEDA